MVYTIFVVLLDVVVGLFFYVSSITRDWSNRKIILYGIMYVVFFLTIEIAYGASHPEVWHWRFYHLGGS